MIKTKIMTAQENTNVFQIYDFFRKKKVNKKQASDKWDVTSFHRLIGQNLHEVLTLGKELFMFFGDSCLRYTHFIFLTNYWKLKYIATA